MNIAEEKNRVGLALQNNFGTSKTVYNNRFFSLRIYNNEREKKNTKNSC